MIYNNLNRVKGILSARLGTLIPKFNPGGSFTDPEYLEWCTKSGTKQNPMTFEEFLALKKLNPTSTVLDLINYTTGLSALPNGQSYADFANSVRNNGQSNVQVLGGNSAIPGGLEVTPYTAVESAARVTRLSNDKVTNATAEANAASVVATKLPTTTTTTTTTTTSTNGSPAESAGITVTNEGDEQPLSKYKTKKQKLITSGAAEKWGQFGQITTLGMLAIGNAFGALQSTTDSETTKAVTAAYDGVSSTLSSMGGVAGMIGQVMGIAKSAGDVIQGITGGTDLISKWDKWMASPLLSWNAGIINDIWGEKSNAFGADLNILAQVGSSYGGTTSDITKAASEADKKFGLFSKKDRQKANAASAAASAKQNIMGDIADTARDLRSMVQSMGEQAGLAYSLMTDGGYSLKYTYAAKHGGLLKQNPIIELEWEPKIELNLELPALKEGSNINEELEWIPEFKNGNKLDFDTWFNSIPEEYRATNYDYKKAYEVFDWDLLNKHAKDPENNHLGSVSPVADENGNFPFLKLGKLDENKELQGEFDWYNSDEGKEHRNKFDIKFIDGRYYYVPKQLKQGGFVGDSDIPEIEETTQKNVIPEGALHKNKHHMEHAEGLTKKGIPVIDDDGEQQAEIEHSEIIFTLEVTKKLEEYYGIFYSEKSTNKEKEQAALDAGKLLVYQILENTEDRTGLIESCKKGGTLTFNKDTEDLIEEVLEWTPTVVVIEEIDNEKLNKKDLKKSEEKSEIAPEKEIKLILKEVLIELLIK